MLDIGSENEDEEEADADVFIYQKIPRYASETRIRMSPGASQTMKCALSDRQEDAEIEFAELRCGLHQRETLNVRKVRFVSQDRDPSELKKKIIKIKHMSLCDQKSKPCYLTGTLAKVRA